MLDGQTIDFTQSQIIGLVGAAMYSTSYFLLAFDKLRGDAPKYFVMQFVAASCMLVSLFEDFNVGSLCIQVFFATVSIIGVTRHLKPKAVKESEPTRKTSFAGLAIASPVPGFLKAPHPCARPDR